MSMREANKLRTICEVLREINDLFNENNASKQTVVPLIKEAEKMAAKMARKLYEYNKEFDKDWWEENKDYEQDLLKRMNNE